MTLIITEHSTIDIDKVGILDLALFPDFYYRNAPEQTRDLFPPIKKQISISDDLWISPVNKNIEDYIMQACDSPGFNFEPTRQFSQLYCFGREKPSKDKFINWDYDGRLQLCIALSRLTHPTSISFQYSVRLVFDTNDNICEIIPGKTSGFGSLAYIADESRNWLTEKDAYDLRTIMSAYDKSPLTKNLARALWFHEYAARTYDLNIRSIFLTTGLEAVIYSSSEKQFCQRIPNLANLIGVGEISFLDAKNFYKLRSKIVHGKGFKDVSEKDDLLYIKVERLTQCVIKNLILDSDFAKKLSTAKEAKQLLK